MKTLAALAILLSLLATSALAANFHCPLPQYLPATLNLRPAPAPQPQLKDIQAYLTNIKTIAKVYKSSAPRTMRRKIVAHCLLIHAASLTETNALQSPITRADGATWFLIHEEVSSALALLQPRDLLHRPEVRYATYWLSQRPAYLPTSPYAIATR